MKATAFLFIVRMKASGGITTAIRRTWPKNYASGVHWIKVFMARASPSSAAKASWIDSKG